MKTRDAKIIPLIAGVAASLSLLAPLSFAQAGWTQRYFKSNHGTLIEFDGPDASTVATFGTQALANNDFGAVVGYWVDSNVIPHAFLRTPEGQFIAFDAPGADLNKGDNGGTVAIAVNNLGVIAGQFEDTNFVFHGFIRYPNGFIFEFDDPSAGSTADALPPQGTIAANVNSRGDTAGYYMDSNGTEHGFIRYHDGNFVTVDPENSLATMICLETCLTDDGTTTGFYVDSNTLTYRGFIRSPAGQYTIFDGPEVNSQPTQGTLSSSISALGVTAGYSFNGEGTAIGYLRTRDGKFFSFEDPLASPAIGTAAFALDIFGVTTGQYNDSNGGSHGFERTANALYANFDAPDNGDNCVPALFLCQGTRPSTNNLWGEVAGWYIDSTSVFHGLVWIPGPGSFQPANNLNTAASRESGVAAADGSLSAGGKTSPAVSGASGSGSPLAMSMLSRFSPRDVGARTLVEKWIAAHSH
jgi:hypothetical protein